MTGNPRIRKTIRRKLGDLDGHIYFLKDSLEKLISGDHSYVKQVAAELRVLVCKAGVEGLIWRINEEIEAPDKQDLILIGSRSGPTPAAFLYSAMRQLSRLLTFITQPQVSEIGSGCNLSIQHMR